MALLCILMLGLSACGGNTENVKTHEVDSEMYSQEDISSAIEVIKKDFKSSVWKDCTLTEIYYAGDETSENHKLKLRRLIL